jgi:catechol 2,3-dioxygenase-like lactoylglutathione lyase family enzyme
LTACKADDSAGFHLKIQGGIVMAKLRHLAILTHQPDKLADFYKRVFEMQEMYRTKNGSVHLSDGEVNLAILNATGLYHFGFHVEDNKEVAKRINEIYPAGAPKEREATYAEGRGSDPDGNLFDISTVGWGYKRRMDL